MPSQDRALHRLARRTSNHGEVPGCAVRSRRDGQGEVPDELIARAPIDVSTRATAAPARIGAIRGRERLAEAQRDAEVRQWWEVWR